MWVRQARGKNWILVPGLLLLACAGLRAQTLQPHPVDSPVLMPAQGAMGSQAIAAQDSMGSSVSGQAQNAVPEQVTVWQKMPPPIAPLPHGEGARRMGERLKKIFDDNDWRADPSKPFERITYYQMLLTHRLSLCDEVAVRMELGNEQLRAGRSERAVETLETLVQHIEPQYTESHPCVVPRNISARTAPGSA